MQSTHPFLDRQVEWRAGLVKCGLGFQGCWQHILSANLCLIVKTQQLGAQEWMRPTWGQTCVLWADVCNDPMSERLRTWWRVCAVLPLPQAQSVCASGDFCLACTSRDWRMVDPAAHTLITTLHVLRQLPLDHPLRQRL